MPPATENYTIISADCHAGGSMNQYREYLESRWHQEFDDWRGAYSNPFKDLQGDTRSRNWDSDRRISEMDADGVVAEVVFPNTVPPFFPTGALIAPPPTATDFERRLAGIRAHNRWLADWCSEHPERRAGIGQIFLNDIDEALADIRWVKENNLRGGVLLPGAPPGSGIPPLFSDEYDPIWALCEELEVCVNHHSGSGNPNYGKHRLAKVLLLVETPFYSHRALEHMILAGVFERHPNMRFIVTEQGLAWIPETLRRLDAYHRQMKSGRVGELGIPVEAHLPELPSFYFNRNCWVGASFPSPRETAAIGGMANDQLAGEYKVGWDKVMWGSDYPHHEGSYPYTREALRNAFSGSANSNKSATQQSGASPELSGASPELLRKVLSENQAEVYGFDMDALAPLAAKSGPTVAEIAEPLDKVPSDATSPAFYG